MSKAYKGHELLKEIAKRNVYILYIDEGIKREDLWKLKEK